MNSLTITDQHFTASLNKRTREQWKQKSTGRKWENKVVWCA